MCYRMGAMPRSTLRTTAAVLRSILESAAARKNYHMALYKTHTALDSLQGEFGIDEKRYQHSGPHSVSTTMATELLEGVLADHKKLEDMRRAAITPSKKKRPSKKP